MGLLGLLAGARTRLKTKPDVRPLPFRRFESVEASWLLKASSTQAFWFQDYKYTGLRFIEVTGLGFRVRCKCSLDAR